MIDADHRAVDGHRDVRSTIPAVIFRDVGVHIRNRDLSSLAIHHVSAE